jgi:hypothetical protein
VDFTVATPASARKSIAKTLAAIIVVAGLAHSPPIVAGEAGAVAPVYLPADPGVAIVDPGLAAGPMTYPGPIVADQYATPPSGACAPGMLNPISPRAFRLVGGVDLTFVQPFFENNDALIVVESDGVTFENIQGIDFDYGAEFAPRVWLKSEWRDGGGIRGAYWQFDHSSGQVAADAPGNAFGRVSPPNRFGGIDITANAPGERLTAQSSLNVFAIDLEGVKDARLENWRLVVSGGVRYAEIDQRYQARLENNGVLAGEIDFRHQIDGFGPTVAILAERPLPAAFTLFTDARIALLFGDGTARLSAGEDLDLVNPFQTTAVFTRDDLLFVAETRIGVLWGPQIFRQWYPFIGIALEGQFWDGAGSASSTEGNMGLFGLNVMLGASW